MSTIAFTPSPVKSAPVLVPSRVFNKPAGNLDISKIPSVFTKTKKQFKKLSVQHWGDLLLLDKEIQNILATDNANDVANKDPRFDPANMGVTGSTLLGEFFYDEEVQRLMDKHNSLKILRKFDLKLFTCVFCVKFQDPKLNLIVGNLVYSNTVDGWHHLMNLYLELRAGNIKGWNPEDWAKFPVPTQTWTTNDPTFPGRLALLLNGEGQSKWGEFDYLRIHANNARFYPKSATAEDKLANAQVQACLAALSLPMSKDDKNAKHAAAITHIGALTQSANADISRLSFIMTQNSTWWPLEDRSAAMFGFYGNIYDEFVRNSQPLSGSVFDDQMLAYNYIIQHMFGNLTGAMQATKAALKQLEVLSMRGWKSPAGDNSLLAIVEIIYMDYLKGPQRISAARGSHTWISSQNKKVNVVDAMLALPKMGSTYTQNMATL